MRSENSDDWTDADWAEVEQEQQIFRDNWAENHPCDLCGKLLNAPFGRKRAYSEYVTLKADSSCGVKAGKVREELSHSLLYIGICCTDKFLYVGASQ